MQQRKILAGVIIFIVIIGIATALKGNFGSPEPLVPELSVQQSGIEKEKERLYLLWKEKIDDSIRSYFEKAIKAGSIVGAGISIVQGDSIVISEGYGKRVANGTAEVDRETIFRLGSLSKGFAGVLAADIKADGKIAWEDKVTDYIPQFKLGDDANTAKIKISNILSHSSGAPYHSFTNLVEADLPVAEIATRFHEVKPQNGPGKQYSYQNAIFALSQEVFRKATGQTVKENLRNRFFVPLGMQSASLEHETLINAGNVALPHSYGKAGWRSLPLKNRYYNAVVAGGIDASAHDMAKWMRFLLGGNPEVLTKAAIAEVFRPVIELRHNNKYYQRWPGHQRSFYGHGWRIHRFQDSKTNGPYTIWHHGGSVNNYRNEIAIYPQADLGICVLLNGNSSLASTVIPDLYNIVKGVYEDRSLEKQ